MIAIALFLIIRSKADKEAVYGDKAIVKVRGWDLEYTGSGDSAIFHKLQFYNGWRKAQGAEGVQGV